MTKSTRTTRRGVGLVVGILTAIAALALSGNAMAETGVQCPRMGLETVATDKPDYPPGETVHITGAGYAFACDVEVRVSRPDGVVESFVATTDLGGSVSFDYVLPGPPGVIGVYRVDMVGSGNEVLASVEFTDATTAVDVAPSQYATGGAGKVFSVLVRNVQGSQARCVRVTLPSGYSALTVSDWNVAGGTAGWALAINTLGGAAREFQITKAAGGGLNSGSTTNWARFEVSVTAPAAPVNTTWVARLAENTACSQNPSDKQIGVRIGAPVDNKTYTATFRDVTTGAEISPSAEAGGSQEYRLRIANTSSKALEYASIAVPFCFSSVVLSAAPNPVTTGSGTVPFVASVSDNFIRLNNGKLDSSGDFVDVRFTATASCSSGTVAFRTAGWENQEPSNDAAKAFGGAHPTVAVEDANDAPTCGNVSATTAEDTPVDGNLACTDADGDTLTYSVVAGPANGDVTVNSTTGAFSYEPDADFNGSDSFTYKANDGVADSNVATVSITVTAVNDAPVAVDDEYNAIEDTQLSVAAPGVLGNDTDVDAGDTLSVTASSPIDGVDHGTLVLNANGSFTYDPAADYCGDDSFTYRAKDAASVESNTATVTIHVACVNDPPDAVDDSASTPEDTAKTFPASGSGSLKANDTDIDNTNAQLFVSAVSDPANGSAVLNGDGSVTYTPDANFFGSDSFTYTLCDPGQDGDATTAGDNLCDTATVNVTVTAVNDAPVVTAGADQSGSENDTIAVSATFTDVEAGDTHTCSIDWGDGSPSSSGTVVEPSGLTPGTCSGSHQYLDDNPTGTPSDDYTVTITLTDDGTTNGSADPKSGSDTLKVTIANVPPVITGMSGPSGPVALGGSASVTTNFTDVGSQDTHTCTYSWDDGTPNTTVSAPGTGDGACTASHTYTAPGVYTVGVTVTDDDTGSATSQYEFVVVYDPSAGFVTGGGRINSPAGAYPADPTLTGRANFGFVSKYKKGATTPSGQTEFQFQAAGLNFHSETYQWLVVSGARAQYKGTGMLNGSSGFGFLLTATDGQVSGGGGTDKFRIKITDSAGVVVYDNRMGASDDIDAADPQTIAGGSIVIHKG